MRYRYTSFFWSRSPVAKFLSTSGNRADTSFPRVMDMMVFWIASFLNKTQLGYSLSGNGMNIPFVGILRPIMHQLASTQALGGATYTNPALSSKVSPFLGAAKAPFILLTAMSIALRGAGGGRRTS